MVRVRRKSQGIYARSGEKRGLAGKVGPCEANGDTKRPHRVAKGGNTRRGDRSSLTRASKKSVRERRTRRKPTSVTFGREEPRRGKEFVYSLSPRGRCWHLLGDRSAAVISNDGGEETRASWRFLEEKKRNVLQSIDQRRKKHS